jgi:hypothetical protein
MVVNCLIRRRLKAPRAGRPGPTMGTPMVILASDMAPPAPASRTILQPKRVSWRCFYACFARSLRSATSAYKGPAIDLIQGADHRPLRYQVVPAILGNWGRQLSGCASRGETSARSPAQQVSADQRRTSSTIITMTAMRTIVPMPIYTTGSPSFESPGFRVSVSEIDRTGQRHGCRGSPGSHAFSVRWWRSASVSGYYRAVTS